MLVIDDRNDAAARQAGALGAERIRFEPMERLRRGDDIDASGWQSRMRRVARNGHEICIALQPRDALRAHIGVRLDGIHRAPAGEQKFGKLPRARADVGNARRGGKAVLFVERVEKRCGIARARLRVVRRPARK